MDSAIVLFVQQAKTSTGFLRSGLLPLALSALGGLLLRPAR
jgi:hypothetical protein